MWLALIVGFLCALSGSANAAYIPPFPVCTSKVAISQTGSADILTLTNNGYICSIMLISATAQNVSLVQGTGSTCGTSTVALIGGTTASVAVAANGGFAVGGAQLVTTTTGQHLCLLQSGSGNVSGFISYLDAP